MSDQKETEMVAGAEKLASDEATEKPEGTDGESKEGEEEGNPDTSQTMSRILGEIPGLRMDLYLGIFFAMGAGVGMSMFAYAFLKIVENLFRDPYDWQQIDDGALGAAMVFFGVGVGMFVGTLFGFGFLNRFAAKTSIHLRKEFFRSLLEQDISYFDMTSTGALNASISSQAKRIEAGFGTQLATFYMNFGQFLSGVVIALIASYKFTLILLAITPIMVLAGVIQGKFIVATTSKSEGLFVKTSARSAEVIGGVRTVKSLNAADTEANSFDQAVDRLYPAIAKKGLIGGLGLATMLFCMFGGMYAFGMWYGTRQVADNRENPNSGFTADEMMGAFFGILMGALGLGTAGATWPEYLTAKVSAQILYNIIDREPEFKKPTAEPLKKPIQGNISLVDVDFYYPSRPDFQVFEKFNLEIKAGQSVALVGPSGCGKSTIIALLERFYDPQGGNIFLDGTPIHEYDMEFVRKQIGFVGQEPVLFDATIADNIKMGLRSDEVSQADMEEATKQANAYDFIMKFPDKFETRVGEKGAQMSGGQKQRVSIARALCRKPKIILLDEATSALDTESEAIVQAALDRIMAKDDTTVIMIAHRLSTVRDADKIVVIHEGKVIQEGTHEDLAADAGGIYATMLQAQDVIGDDKAAKQRRRDLSLRANNTEDDPLKLLKIARQTSNPVE